MVCKFAKLDMTERPQTEASCPENATALAGDGQCAWQRKEHVVGEWVPRGAGSAAVAWPRDSPCGQHGPWRSTAGMGWTGDFTGSLILFQELGMSRKDLQPVPELKSAFQSLPPDN